jgi:hypothetical protein
MAPCSLSTHEPELCNGCNVNAEIDHTNHFIGRSQSDSDMLGCQYLKLNNYYDQC